MKCLKNGSYNQIKCLHCDSCKVCELIHVIKDIKREFLNRIEFINQHGEGAWSNNQLKNYMKEQLLKIQELENNNQIFNELLQCQ